MGFFWIVSVLTICLVGVHSYPQPYTITLPPQYTRISRFANPEPSTAISALAAANSDTKIVQVQPIQSVLRIPSRFPQTKREAEEINALNSLLAQMPEVFRSATAAAAAAEQFAPAARAQTAEPQAPVRRQTGPSELQQRGGYQQQQQQQSGGYQQQQTTNSEETRVDSQSSLPPGFSNENSVLCRPNELPDGTINYDCDGGSQDLTLRSKHVLWLSGGADGSDRNLRINIPNYNIEGLIQAAQKQGEGGGQTNISINLQKPQLSYSAEQQESLARGDQKYNVELQYDKLAGQTIHFADDGANSKRYSPTSGSILEP